MISWGFPVPNKTQVYTAMDSLTLKSVLKTSGNKNAIGRFEFWLTPYLTDELSF